uniref:Uncharacterized protein n=1 Tax=Sinocyclocheilus grahami TaxID=75366 RepID=A0A672N986_SINGR
MRSTRQCPSAQSLRHTSGKEPAKGEEKQSVGAHPAQQLPPLRRSALFHHYQQKPNGT